MPVYKAPLRDMKFLLDEVFDYEAHYKTISTGANATPDVVDAILSECAKLCEDVIAPRYTRAEEKACGREMGKAKTLTGYKEANEEKAPVGWKGRPNPKNSAGRALPAP